MRWTNKRPIICGLQFLNLSHPFWGVDFEPYPFLYIFPMQNSTKKRESQKNISFISFVAPVLQIQEGVADAQKQLLLRCRWIFSSCCNFFYSNVIIPLVKFHCLLVIKHGLPKNPLFIGGFPTKTSLSWEFSSKPRFIGSSI